MSKSDAYELVLRPMQAVFSPPPRSVEIEESAALEEYAAALSRFDARDLTTGWHRVRETYKRAFWPPIAILVEACFAARRLRSSQTNSAPIHGRIVNGRIEPWSGACRCSRCVERKSDPEFYHAPEADRLLAEAELRETEAYWAKRYAELPLP